MLYVHNNSKKATLFFCLMCHFFYCKFTVLIYLTGIHSGPTVCKVDSI